MTDLKSILNEFGNAVLSQSSWISLGGEANDCADQAHQQILDWVDREIIGEDEDELLAVSVVQHTPMSKNELRNEQRNKLNALKEGAKNE